MPRSIYRESQGRGISPFVSTVGVVDDETSLIGFEVQAAKANAQNFCQIIDNTEDEQVVEPSAFDSSTDIEHMTDEEIKELVEGEKEDDTQVIDMTQMRSAQIVWQQLPRKYRMELLDTKRPNLNTTEFCNYLIGRAASTIGLARQYATLAASGADYKAQRLISEPFFNEVQKFLE